ncbi:hypothetical protein [Rhizobium lentis]|uniref:hypothetical protein n=1 Tax=Rhizobium lentis TaxID=1138194 RepID=UPI0038620970
MLLRLCLTSTKTGPEVLCASRIYGSITPLWLLSADQVADHLTKGPGQPDRSVGQREGNARPVLFGNRPVIDSFVGNRDVAGAEMAALVVERPV